MGHADSRQLPYLWDTRCLMFPTPVRVCRTKELTAIDIACYKPQKVLEQANKEETFKSDAG